MIGGWADGSRFQTSSKSVDGSVANRSKRSSNLEEIGILRPHGRWVGVKSSSFSDKLHVMPAKDAQIVEEGYLIRLRYPAALINKAPSFSPRAALVQGEREKINTGKA
jgi:hypothetical protein